jgi:hypothetical protein
LNHTQKEDAKDTLILNMKKNMAEEAREKQLCLSYTKHTITNISFPLKLTGIIITNFKAPYEIRYQDSCFRNNTNIPAYRLFFVRRHIILFLSAES